MARWASPIQRGTHHIHRSYTAFDEIRGRTVTAVDTLCHHDSRTSVSEEEPAVSDGLVVRLVVAVHSAIGASRAFVTATISVRVLFDVKVDTGIVSLRGILQWPRIRCLFWPVHSDSDGLVFRRSGGRLCDCAVWGSAATMGGRPVFQSFHVPQGAVEPIACSKEPTALEPRRLGRTRAGENGTTGGRREYRTRRGSTKPEGARRRARAAPLRKTAVD